MPRLYVKASAGHIAYSLDGGEEGYQQLPSNYSQIEADYIAIIYGLTEYFNKWNKELDTRAKVRTPSDNTKRPLPPPVLVLSDNEVVVRQLNKVCRIEEVRLVKLAKNIWDMTKNLEVKIEWCSRKENLARKMLP